MRSERATSGATSSRSGTTSPRRQSRASGTGTGTRGLPPPAPIAKWTGGKRQLLPQMAPFLMREFRDYHEPFLGGGAVFFELAAQGFFDGDRRAHLNDALRPLMRTYRAVRANPVAVVKKLRSHRYGEAAYYRMRDRDYRAITTDVDLAVWFLYVNRCGFNGMWRVNQSGGFNV